MSKTGPQRLHPVWIVYSAIQSLRAMIIPLVIVLVTGGRDAEFLVIGLSLLAAALLAGVRAVAWLRFSYEVTPEGIRVRSGLISLNDRFLPRERIQAVDLNENVLHRLLGVVAVKIESAAGGGGEADITLEALSRTAAEALRADLLGSRAAVSGVSEGAPAQPALARASQGELIAALSYGQLLVAGATAGKIGPLFALVFTAFQLVDDILPQTIWQRAEEYVPSPTIQLLVLIVAGGGILAWLLSIGWAVLTYGGFELRLIDDRLHASYGLLERRRVTIPRARIQAVTISEGLLRQPFGFASIRAESAGFGTDRAESGALMPIIKLAEVPAFLALACPRFAADPHDETATWETPPPRAMRRYALGPVWPMLVLTGFAVAATRLVGVAWEWGLLGLLALPVAGAFGVAQFRAAGWRLEADGLFLVRRRPLDRVTTVTRGYRIQIRELSANPLQRQARLATFVARVASAGTGGGVTIQHLDEEDGLRLLDRLAPAPPAPSPGALLDRPSARQ